MSSLKAEVVFPYDAEQEDELSLAVGNIITNIDMQDEGWWEGELDGKRGVFPENFVKLIKEEAETDTKTQTSSFPKATVTFDYDAAEDDELDLKKGEIIEVIKQEEEGWWEGRYQGKVGMFPSNFVELISEKPVANEVPTPRTESVPKDVPSDKPSSQEKIQHDEDAEAKKPKPPPMGFGFSLSNADLTKARLRPVSATEDSKTMTPKIEEANKPTQRVPPLGQADAPTNLKKVEPAVNGAVTKRNAPAPPSSQTKPALTPAVAPPATGERYSAKFDYEPENDDEIALNIGDIVMVTNKDVCEGWWEGTVNGKTGVFPNNFVEPAPLPAPAEEKPKERVKKPILPHGGKVPILPAKKAEPPEVTKPDSKPSPPLAKKPIMPESKKPTVVEQEKAANQETTKPGLPKPDLPKPELPKPDLPKPELPRPDLPKPEFKKPPPPVSKSKPVPPKPSVVTKPPAEEPQRTNSFRNILNNSLAERGRIPSINKKPPARPPADASLHANQPHEAPISKESAPPRPEKPKHEPEKKVEKDVKTEENSLDLDSISASDVLQNVNKTRVKGPGKTLPGKYTQSKENSPEDEQLQNQKKESVDKEQTKAVTLTQTSSKPPPGNEAAEELKKEMANVQNKMIEMEKKLMKQIKVLTDDLDSERKQRASMQIEIDRLKKKVSILEGL